MNGKSQPQKEMATQMAGMSLQQQIIKPLYPSFNTDFSLTLMEKYNTMQKKNFILREVRVDPYGSFIKINKKANVKNFHRFHFFRT